MSDASLADKIQALPKWLVLSVTVILVVAIGYLGIYYGLGLNKSPKDEVTEPESLLPDMPNAVVSEDNRTQLQAYRDGEVINSSRSSVEDYWDNLGSDLISSNANEELSRADEMDALRSSGNYSELELRQIRDGIRTKTDIDLEHEREKELIARRSGQGSRSGHMAGNARPMTQAQRDSAYFARMERTLEIASRYSTTGSSAEDEEEEGSTDTLFAEASERTISLDKKESVLPTESFDGNSIISSLDSPSDNGVVHYSSRTAKPVKATFLKNEKLQSGQRVIIRLMQDLILSDGTVIPANSHITGTCSFEKRFKIDVKMLHYGGRMFPVDISVYDNDGTEGLYCPIVDHDKKKKKAVKDVAQGVVNAAGSVAGTLLTGNPLLGAVASRSLNSVSGSINTDGTMSINVMAGYEFYVFENVKNEKKG